MGKWYRARFGKIEEVEIARSTDKFVVFQNGRREAIDSEWTWYRVEREQAKLAMIAQYESERNRAAEVLRQEEERLSEAKKA